MTDLEVEFRNLYVECPFPKKPSISVVDLLEMVCHDIEVLKKEVLDLKDVNANLIRELEETKQDVILGPDMAMVNKAVKEILV